MTILLKLENQRRGAPGALGESGNSIQIEESEMYLGALFIGNVEAGESLGVGVHLMPSQEYELLELLMKRQDKFVIEKMNERLDKYGRRK